MSVIGSTSGRLHSEFIRILFLQAHRETDRFFASSGVLSAQSDRGFFHYDDQISGVRVSHKVHGSDSDIDDGGWFL